MGRGVLEIQLDGLRRRNFPQVAEISNWGAETAESRPSFGHDGSGSRIKDGKMGPSHGLFYGEAGSLTWGCLMQTLDMFTCLERNVKRAQV